MPQQPFPLLTTKRLLLRQLQLTDDKAIFALRSNTQLNTYIQRPLPSDISDAQYFINSINEGIANKEWLYWVLILKDTQQLIGTICLWHFSNDNTMAEIGYELHPDFQGVGLMNEALQAVIDYGFTTRQLQTIEAYTQPENTKSVSLLAKNKFKQDIKSNTNSTSREVRFVLSRP